LVVCPKCGYVVVNAPEKTWPIPSREPSKADAPQRLVGIYSCTNCGVRFRSAVESDPKPVEPEEVEKPLEEQIALRAERLPLRVNISDKISSMETERLRLVKDIGRLKRILSRRDNRETQTTAFENKLVCLASSWA
jgi:uncharacterized Zn finger protein (UPF0148 family)